MRWPAQRHAHVRRGIAGTGPPPSVTSVTAHPPVAPPSRGTVGRRQACSVGWAHLGPLPRMAASRPRSRPQQSGSRSAPPALACASKAHGQARAQTNQTNRAAVARAGACAGAWPGNARNAACAKRHPSPPPSTGRASDHTGTRRTCAAHGKRRARQRSSGAASRRDKMRACERGRHCGCAHHAHAGIGQKRCRNAKTRGHALRNNGSHWLACPPPWRCTQRRSRFFIVQHRSLPTVC